jgi:hypothetical protein
MNSSFHDVRTVLDMLRDNEDSLLMRPPHRGRPRVYFMWPFFMRQVLVRERTQLRLNLFQQHVLMLCEVGVRDIDEIASLLMDDAPAAALLASRVVAELQRGGMLDERLRATPDWRRMLDDGAAAVSEETTARYLFQDPWEPNNVWNRFPDKLQQWLIDIRWTRRDGNLFAVLASEGRPRDRGMIVRPDAVSDCRLPEIGEVRKACADYADDWRLHIGSGEEDEATVGLVAPPRDVTDIVHIGEAEPVLLQAVAFIPDDADDARDRLPWETSDPFGLGINRPFRDHVDTISRRPEFSAFGSWLQDRLAERRGKQDGAAKNVVRRAEVVVDHRLGGTLRHMGVLQDELIIMQHAVYAIDEHLEQQNRREAAADVRQAFGSAQVALEYAFKALAERFPTAYAYAAVDELVSGDRKQSAEALTRVARRLGFAMAKDETGREGLPARLTHVRPEKIAAGADRQQGSINSLLWAAVLAAASAGDPLDGPGSEHRHPLLDAAAKYPEMLIDLSRIAEIRDEVNHAVTPPERYLKEAREIPEQVYQIVELLLLDSYASSSSSRA